MASVKILSRFWNQLFVLLDCEGTGLKSGLAIAGHGKRPLVAPLVAESILLLVAASPGAPLMNLVAVPNQEAVVTPAVEVLLAGPTLVPVLIPVGGAMLVALVVLVAPIVLVAVLTLKMVVILLAVVLEAEVNRVALATLGIAGVILGVMVVVIQEAAWVVLEAAGVLVILEAAWVVLEAAGVPVVLEAAGLILEVQRVIPIAVATLGAAEVIPEVALVIPEAARVVLGAAGLTLGVPGVIPEAAGVNRVENWPCRAHRHTREPRGRRRNLFLGA